MISEEYTTKRIAVLLNGRIKNDARVTKEINTLSKIAKVDLFYIDGQDDDKLLFNDNVRLFSHTKENNFKTKIKQNTCFYNEFLFFVKEVLQAQVRYDYVWANDLPCLKPAALIKKKMKCQLIYDSHEIYVSSINQFFPDKAPFFKAIVFKILIKLMTTLGNLTEKRYVKKVDKFLTVNTSIKQYFENRFKRNDVQVVMNCPKVPTDSDVYDWRAEFPISKEDYIILYQGNLNKGRALSELIEAMKYVNSNIKLIILGNGTIKNDLVNKTAELKLQEKVFFKDLVPYSELLKHTRGADVGIHLAPYSFNLNTTLSLPNKLFEYIHANIPVVMSNVVENRKVVDNYRVGILTDNTPTQIAQAINTIVKSDMREYKENCKKAALEYNWENQEKVILNLIAK